MNEFLNRMVYSQLTRLHLIYFQFEAYLIENIDRLITINFYKLQIQNILRLQFTCPTFK